MAMKYYTYRRLSELFCDIIEGDSENRGAVNLKYEPSRVHGSLDDCMYNGFNLTDRVGGGPDSLDDVDLAVWELVREEIPDSGSFVRSRLVLDMDSVTCAYVIAVDESEIDLGAYRCPVCGQDDEGFQTFPPTEFDMDKTGAMTVPAGMAVDPSFDDDVACNCKKCGFQGHKAAFDTGGWDEYTGRVI